MKGLDGLTGEQTALQIGRRPVSVREGVAVPLQGAGRGVFPVLLHIVLHHRKRRQAADKEQQNGENLKQKQTERKGKERFSLSNTPLPAILLIRTEIIRLRLAASCRRCLLLPPRLALVLLAPPLSLPDGHRH